MCIISFYCVFVQLPRLLFTFQTFHANESRTLDNDKMYSTFLFAVEYGLYCVDCVEYVLCVCIIYFVINDKAISRL